jgi:hypothetical protein
MQFRLHPRILTDKTLVNQILLKKVLPVKMPLVRALGLLALAALAVSALSCGNGKPAAVDPALPNLSGPWEFLAISSDGTISGIEVNIQEGKILEDGLMEPNGQITATNTQINFVTLKTASSVYDATGFGGSCPPITTANSLSGSVTATNAPITFTFSENGNLFNVAATLSGDGQSILNGTYTAQSGDTCTDSGGTISGYTVSKLFGTYAGNICPLASTSACSSQSDAVSAAALSESSSGAATLSLVITGTDNTTFTMNGQVTANAFQVQGTFQGQPVIYDGYYESYKGNPALYLVNVTNPATPFAVGTLGLQPVP